MVLRCQNTHTAAPLFYTFCEIVRVSNEWRGECVVSYEMNSKCSFYEPIDVYTIFSGYELYEIPDPIGGGGEWLDKYGGVLPLPCM